MIEKHLVKLKVHADSRKPHLERKADDAFEVWVKAEAERGMANRAALCALAAALGVEAKTVEVL